MSKDSLQTDLWAEGILWYSPKWACPHAGKNNKSQNQTILLLCAHRFRVKIFYTMWLCCPLNASMFQPWQSCQKHQLCAALSVLVMLWIFQNVFILLCLYHKDTNEVKHGPSQIRNLYRLVPLYVPGQYRRVSGPKSIQASFKLNPEPIQTSLLSIPESAQPSQVHS